ncbi:MAG TPA: prepilin-type N-terminal cleavage/methylation domain-containing protein [Phycisphaerae bacterium]|jgi:prepilin-type N-terminal cleavage/methylation domain-containing protein|nr:prepilin-type N-terminal cleavage/methylation domain-containing protein [Phycisphaerae bacterium]
MQRGTRAFTLIELLVVVAIIALLISILLPSLSGARQRANKVKCATNLRSLALLDFQYSQENNYIVPRDSSGSHPSVFYLLATMQRIKLTAGTSTGNFESEYKDAYSKLKWLNCPSFPKVGQAVCFVDNAFNPANIGSTVPYMRTNQIKRPQDTVNFADGNTNLPVDSFDVYDLWDPGHIQSNATSAVSGGSHVGRVLSDTRHRGEINLSYYDSHVDSKPYKKLTMMDFVN